MTDFTESRIGSRPDDPWHVGRWLQQELAAADDLGYFGPASAAWAIHREAILSLGLLRALLLQLAHPWVAQAVADHSTFHKEPLERLAATVSAAELIVYGSRAQADATADRIRAVHDRIVGTLSEDTGVWRRGTPYRAHDSAALLWVLATLMETTVVVYESCFARLTDSTLNDYLAECGIIGRMVGIPPEMVPRDRSSLQRYMEEMTASRQVAVGRIARDFGSRLMRFKPPGAAAITSWPYLAAARATATLTMPEPLRTQYAPILRLRGATAYRVAGRACRMCLPLMPSRVRYDPIASAAMERVPG